MTWETLEDARARNVLAGRTVIVGKVLGHFRDGHRLVTTLAQARARYGTQLGLEQVLEAIDMEVEPELAFEIRLFADATEAESYAAEALDGFVALESGAPGWSRRLR